MVDLETLRGPRRGMAHEKNGALETRLAGGPFAAERFSERGAEMTEAYGGEEKMQGESFFACMQRAGVLLLWCQICLAWARLDSS